MTPLMDVLLLSVLIALLAKLMTEISKFNLRSILPMSGRVDRSHFLVCSSTHR